MAVTKPPPELRIDVSHDASEARVVIPPEAPPEHLTPEHCCELLRSAGVEVTDPVRHALHAVLGRAADQLGQAERQPIQAVVATAEPPEHGRNGWVQWLVDRPAPKPADDGATGVSHYERSPFIFVDAGQTIGHVHPPTAPRPGRDVTGAQIEAEEGRPIELQHDESIQQLDTGELIAQTAGVLVRHQNHASIEHCLEVEQDVDFSTGHIEFNGTVHINGGVKDRFRVKASGRVDVCGLIEAATIETKEDLLAHGGFAGRERGYAYIQRDLQARYLDNVQGAVGNDLIVEREIINCQLTVHGNLHADGGALIGGSVNVTGSVHLGLLGARAGTPTELIIGRVPKLEPIARSLNKRLTQIDERRQALRKRIERLDAKGDPDASQEKPQLNAELGRLDQLHEKSSAALNRLRAAITDRRTVDVQVDKRLCPGVVLVVGQKSYRIRDEVRGPLRIQRDRRNQVMYQQGANKFQSISHIADAQT